MHASCAVTLRVQLKPQTTRPVSLCEPTPFGPAGPDYSLISFVSVLNSLNSISGTGASQEVGEILC